MQNETYGKWWLFQLTDKQVLAIQSKDHAAIRQFWLDNEELLRRIVCKCWSLFWANGTQLHVRRYYTRDDALHQIYVDLPLYDYRSSRTLYYSMLRSVKYCNSGGYLHKQQNSDFAHRSLEANFNCCDNYALQDVLRGANDIEDLITPHDKHLLRMEAIYERVAKIAFPQSEVLQQQFLRAI